MADALTTGAHTVGSLAGFTDWFSNNPVISAILIGLLALFFFFYLLVRRTILGFKEGMQGGNGK